MRFIGNRIKEHIKNAIINFNKKDKFKEINNNFSNKEKEIEKVSHNVAKLIDDVCEGYIIEAQSQLGSIQIPTIKKGDFALVMQKGGTKPISQIEIENGYIRVGNNGSFMIIVFPIVEQGIDSTIESS